jgi:hypothetical protein
VVERTKKLERIKLTIVYKRTIEDNFAAHAHALLLE